MITIFNRKELVVTMDMKRQGDVRGILSANGIKYKIKVINLQGASLFGSNRTRYGSFGINQNFSYLYKIYVHKKDYSNAFRLIK